MELYNYLNFFAFAFFVAVFIFLYLLMVILNFRLRLYRQLRNFFINEVEFWNPNDANRIVKKLLKRVDKQP